MGKSKLAARSPSDSRTFLHEDKFDTWLDLTSCKKVRDYAATVPEWKVTMYTRASDPDIPMTVETSCELRCAGVTPQMVSKAIITPTLPSILNQIILTEGSMRSIMRGRDFRTMTNTVQEAAAKSVGVQISHYLSNTSESYTQHVWESIDVWVNKLTMIPSPVMRAWAAAEDLLCCLEIHRRLYEYSSNRHVLQRTEGRMKNIRRRYQYNDGIALPSLQARCYIAKDVCLMHVKGRLYLMDRPLFLELVNKCVELFCALVYSHMLDGTTMPVGHLDCARQFFLVLSQEVDKWSPTDSTTFNMAKANRGFSFLKTVEGLGVAVIIHREDGPRGWVNSTLLNNLWSALYDDDIVDVQDMRDSDFGRLINVMKTEQIAELIGTIKLCGHPSIEFEKGLDKLYQRTHNNIVVDEEAVRNSSGVVKRDLLINFYKRHNRYPALDTQSVHLHPTIRRIITGHHPPHSSMFAHARNSLTSADWNTIDFLKNADFDPVDNQIVLLKDKALGITRSKVLRLLAAGENTWSQKDRTSMVERRALLQFLLSDELTAQFHEYLSDFSQGDGLDASVLEYLVIKLTAKELEEKPEGRMFGSSPLVERNRRIVMEMNVMNMMDLYEPDQLLTPDELSIIRKMYSFRHFGGMFPNHTLMQVSFDFSKWNNNMRRASIDVPAGAVLDPWFGTHLYCKTMLAYENALVYYTDQHRTRHWDGQLGGIEGLNQATWSLFFLGGIKHMLEERGLMYQVTVKGDDVRAAIAVPNQHMGNAQAIEQMKNDILGDLQQLCHRMGWELNPHECFVSLSVIATSKQYQVNNTWLPASTKKAMKMASLSNLVFPTLEDVVSSIFSTAHSTCAQATVVLPAFATASLLSSLEIIRGIPRLVDQPLMVTAALVWPQVLGGPGSLPLQTFFVRGENDMLSVSISLLRYILLSDDDEMRQLVIYILSQELTNVPDGRLLLSDPYALSLEIPERPSTVMKRLLRDSLKKWTKNEHIQRLLSASTDDDEEQFISHLLSMVPYCAKVATTLWECSPFYIIEEILSRFMQSSTIFAFFAMGSGRRLNLNLAHRRLSSMLRAADNRIQYWVHVLDGTQSLDTDLYLGIAALHWNDTRKCTTQITHMVRNHAWAGVVQGEIHGITYPSIVDQVLFYQPSDLISAHDTWEISSIVTNIHCDASLARPQTTTNDSHHYSACEISVPWLGAVTSSKLELPNVAPDIRSPTISKILRLINLKRSGHFIGLPFTLTADKVIKSLTAVDLTDLNVLSPESGGGHIPHRVAINAFSMTTMPNFRPNLIQLVDMARDQGSVFTGDTHNRTINFAARYYHGVVLATWPLQSYRCVPQSYPRVHSMVFHYDIDTNDVDGTYMPCTWCCQDVNDVEVNYTNPICPDLQSYRYIPLVGASDCDNKLLRSSCQRAMVGKIQREVARQDLDAANPLAVEAAATIVINKLARESVVVSNASKARGFMVVPMGALASVLAVTMGIKNIKSVSMNLIRAIPSESLYLCVLREYLSWYFQTVTDEYGMDTLSLISVMMPHLNTLLYLFNEICDAGQQLRLIQGSKRYGWAHLDLAATANNDANLFFQGFASAHETLIQSILHGLKKMPSMKLCTQCESSGRVEDLMQSHFHRVRRLVLKKCCIFQKRGHVLQILESMMVQRYPDKWSMLIRSLTNYDTVAEMEEECDDPNVTMAVDAAFDMISTHWNMNDWICEALHQVFFLVLAPYMVQYNEDCLYAAEMSESIDILIDTTTLVDYLDVPPMRWTSHMIDDDGDLKWVIDTSWKELQYQGWFKLLVAWSTTNMTEETYLATTVLLQQIRNLITSWGAVHVIRMVGEDADRVLRQAGINADGLTEHEADRMIRRERIRLAREARLDESQLTIHQQPCWLCGHNIQLGGMRQHPIQPGAFVDAGNPMYGGWSRTPFDTLIPWNVDRSRHVVNIEASEYTRCVGFHNTSAAKYAELLSAEGILHHCRSFQTPANIVCLADGLGGVTALLMRAIPLSVVIYNSLFVAGGSNRNPADANPNLPPMEVMSYSSDREWLSRCIYEGLFPGDLCLPEVQDMICATIKNTHQPTSLITCDADVDWRSGPDLAINLMHAVLRVLLTIKSTTCYTVIKTFAVQHDDFNHWLWNVNGILNHLHIVRCVSTRPISTEIFIVIPPITDGNFDHMLYMLSEIRTKRSGFANSLVRSTWLECQILPIAQQIRDYYDRSSMKSVPVDKLYDLFKIADARPLSLSASLNSLYCYSPFAGDHVCKLFPDIAAHIRTTRDHLIEICMAMIPELRGQGKFVPVKTPKGAKVTQGEKAFLMTIRKIAKLTTAHNLMAYTSSRYGPPPLVSFWESIEDTYGTIITICEQAPLLVHHTFDRNGLIINTQHGQEHLFPTVYASAKKFCNITGSVMYACSKLPDTSGLQELHRDLRIVCRDCEISVDHIKLWNRFELVNNLVVPLTLVDIVSHNSFPRVPFRVRTNIVRWTQSIPNIAERPRLEEWWLQEQQEIRMDYPDIGNLDLLEDPWTA